jgi:hypothetical protein
MCFGNFGLYFLLLSQSRRCDCDYGRGYARPYRQAYPQNYGAFPGYGAYGFGFGGCGGFPRPW